MLITLPVRPIQTENLILRAPAAQDFEPWAAFAASPRAQYIGGPLTRPLAWRAFCHAIGHWVARGFGAFVFTHKDSDAALGMCGPWQPINWPEREIGWTLWDAAHEGRGLAAEATAAALSHAFTTLGWTTAVSYIAPANRRSIALAERLGARPDQAATTIDDHADDLVYRHTASLWAPNTDGGIEAYA
jgi:RimJ/RimL family protein N-acetyltransferase